MRPVDEVKPSMFLAVSGFHRLCTLGIQNNIFTGSSRSCCKVKIWVLKRPEIKIFKSAPKQVRHNLFLEGVETVREVFHESNDIIYHLNCCFFFKVFLEKHLAVWSLQPPRVECGLGSGSVLGEECPRRCAPTSDWSSRGCARQVYGQRTVGSTAEVP